MTSPEDSGEYFKTVVDRLIEEACLLLEDVLKATEASDSRAKAQKAHWTERHRLQVLLEAAVETQKSLPSTIVAPWFLAELRGTLDVVRRWQQSPYWPNIEKSLKDKDAFDHTIAMLHVAEHLEWGGHKVEIVKEGISPSPDLTLRAIGGSQDAIVIECYQPAVLRGKPSELVTKEAENIVKKSMEKAKRQIGAEIPGIIAICGYNQSSSNLRVLEEVAEKRLSITDRTSFGGFLLIKLGVTFSREGDKLSFTTTRSAEFIRNPAYFGRIDIEAKVPKDNPNLIKSELTDILTDALVSGNTKALLPKAEHGRREGVYPRRAKAIKLTVVKEPEALGRSIVHGKGEKVPPLFLSEGNVDYQCGQCGVLLAERIWKFSLSNVVIQCPLCNSYNETAILQLRDYPTVLITKGNYYFSNAVRLKAGRCLRGK